MASFNHIIKYLSGNASPEEAQQLDDWKQASIENEAYFNAIATTWNKSTHSKFRLPATEKQWAQFQSKYINPKPTKLITLRRLAIAASFIGITFLAYFLFNPLSTQHETKYAHSGNDTLIIRLTDASLITLYPNSTLSYPDGFSDSSRQIQLKGKAQFKVSHDAKRQFRVKADYCNVAVLGTIFEMEEKEKEVIVSVKKGVVRVSTAKQSIVITSNQAVRCQVNQEIERTTILASFEFVDTPLKTALEQLKAVFGIQYKLTNKQLENCTLSATISNESLSTILDVISTTLNLNYKIESNVITVSGSSCQY